MKKVKYAGMALLFGSIMLAAWTEKEVPTAPVNNTPLILDNLKVQQKDENTIYITSKGFDKPEHWVGKTIPVTWINIDSQPHTVTDDQGYFDSGTLMPGETFTFSFPNAGTWSYYDKYTGIGALINVFGRDE